MNIHTRTEAIDIAEQLLAYLRTSKEAIDKALAAAENIESMLATGQEPTEAQLEILSQTDWKTLEVCQFESATNVHRLVCTLDPSEDC